MSCLFQVIQVYISWKNISMTVPKVKLVQFLRVAVHHGGDIGFGFSIAARDMAVWQDDVGWVIKQGIHSPAVLPLQVHCVDVGNVNPLFVLSIAHIVRTIILCTYCVGDYSLIILFEIIFLL